MHRHTLHADRQTDRTDLHYFTLHHVFQGMQSLHYIHWATHIDIHACVALQHVTWHHTTYNTYTNPLQTQHIYIALHTPGIYYMHFVHYILHTLRTLHTWHELCTYVRTYVIHTSHTRRHALHFISLHYTTIHYILHWITLHRITLHCITLSHDISLHRRNHYIHTLHAHIHAYIQACVITLHNINTLHTYIHTLVAYIHTLHTYTHYIRTRIIHHVRTYVCMYVCMYVGMYVCMYVCV